MQHPAGLLKGESNPLPAVPGGEAQHGAGDIPEDACQVRHRERHEPAAEPIGRNPPDVGEDADDSRDQEQGPYCDLPPLPARYDEIGCGDRIEQGSGKQARIRLIEAVRGRPVPYEDHGAPDAPTVTRRHRKGGCGEETGKESGSVNGKVGAEDVGRTLDLTIDEA